MKTIVISLIAFTCGAQATSYEEDGENSNRQIGYPLVRTSPLRIPTTFPPQSSLYLEVLERNHAKCKTSDDDSESNRPSCVPALKLPEIDKKSG